MLTRLAIFNYRSLRDFVVPRSQVIVVSHAPRLIAALEEQRGCHPIPLEKVLGETRIAGRTPRPARMALAGALAAARPLAP